jgi:hypothetical protein
MKIRTIKPATVIASFALLFSLSGTAVAGALITGAQVKNNSLAGVDIKNESLGSADVRNGSLLPKDFKAGSLPSGPQGLQGPAGPPGAQGNPGLNGVSGLEIVTLPSGAMDSDTEKSVTATCPAGKKIVGGGGYAIGVFGFPDDVGLVASYPVSGTGWRVVAREINAFAGAWLARAYAVCANVPA